MLEPLQKYICDYCGEIINSTEEGYVEWLSERDEKTGRSKYHGFKIVHHRPDSPNKDEGGCYHYTHEPGRQDVHLRHFTGEAKMAHILSLIDVGPYHDPGFRGPRVRDVREYIDFVRRLTIPYFEEARRYWHRAVEDGYFSDANEVWIYIPDNLRELIERYGRT